MTPPRSGGMGAPGRMGGMPGMMGTGGMGPGMPGMMGGPGGSGGMGPGMPGMMGGSGASSGASAQETDPGEVTWWYHYPEQGIHYAFLMNKKGNVIQIQQYGWDASKAVKVKGKMIHVKNRTRQGIGLGSTFAQILTKYNFSTDGERTGDNMVMRYGNETSILAFQLVNNKVAGITLGYKK